MWLVEHGVPRCALLPSSNLVPFGRCGGTREAGSTVAQNLIALYRWVRTRFGEDGGQLDHRRAREMLNPCARESKARTGRF